MPLTRGLTSIDGIGVVDADLNSLDLNIGSFVETEDGWRYRVSDTQSVGGIALDNGNYANPIYPDKTVPIQDDLAALQALELPDGLRVELIAGDRYYTNATQVDGKGELLASGNYAIPVGGLMGRFNVESTSFNTAAVSSVSPIVFNAPAGKIARLKYLEPASTGSYVSGVIVNNGVANVIDDMDLSGRNFTGSSTTLNSFLIGADGGVNDNQPLLILDKVEGETITISRSSDSPASVSYYVQFGEYV